MKASVNYFSYSGSTAGNLGCLAPGGQLLDIGKSNIWSSAHVKQERVDVNLILLAVGAARADNPHYHPLPLLHLQMKRLAALLSYSELNLPKQIWFGLGYVSNAFKRLVNNKAFGKCTLFDSSSQQMQNEVRICGGSGALGVLYTLSKMEAGASLLKVYGRNVRLSITDKRIYSRMLRQAGLTLCFQMCNIQATEGCSALLDTRQSSQSMPCHDSSLDFVVMSGVLRDSTLPGVRMSTVRLSLAAKGGKLLEAYTTSLPSNLLYFSSHASLRTAAWN